MKDNPPWLFLEPYVHMVRCNDGLLLYNTLSKTVLEFAVSHDLAELVNDLLNPGNGYTVRLTTVQLQNPEIQEFIIKLRELFMGDLLDPAWSEGKPVNIFPEPFVKFGLNPTPRKQLVGRPEVDLRNYLQEIILFLNSGSEEEPDPFSTAYLQFSYPGCVEGKGGEMNIDLFRAVMEDVNNYTPTLIHISGRNLITYPDLEDVIRILGSSPFQKKYHLSVEHWEEQIVHFILIQKQTALSLYVTLPEDPETITKCLERLPDQKLLKKIEFNFIVSDREELLMAQDIIRVLNLSNVFLKPFYTGKNINFFSDNVFVNREEILAAQPDQQQVFSRISINENDFGKLWVLPSGKVFANLNDPSPGEVTGRSLVDLVTRELNTGISWRRTRKDISPCKNCLYQFLCPPISSYEIFMQRFNFCDVILNGEES